MMRDLNDIVMCKFGYVSVCLCVCFNMLVCVCLTMLVYVCTFEYVSV